MRLELEMTSADQGLTTRTTITTTGTQDGYELDATAIEWRIAAKLSTGISWFLHKT
jgi:hypothetical protein